MEAEKKLICFFESFQQTLIAHEHNSIIFNDVSQFIARFSALFTLDFDFVEFDVQALFTDPPDPDEFFTITHVDSMHLKSTPESVFTSTRTRGAGFSLHTHQLILSLMIFILFV